MAWRYRTPGQEVLCSNSTDAIILFYFFCSFYSLLFNAICDLFTFNFYLNHYLHVYDRCNPLTSSWFSSLSSKRLCVFGLNGAL